VQRETRKPSTSTRTVCPGISTSSERALRNRGATIDGVGFSTSGFFCQYEPDETVRPPRRRQSIDARADSTSSGATMPGKITISDSEDGQNSGSDLPPERVMTVSEPLERQES